MLNVKMPQALFNAQSSLQEVMSSVGVGVVPIGVNTSGSKPYIEFSDSFDIGSFAPSSMIEIYEYGTPCEGRFSARAAFFAQGMRDVNKMPPFADAYRKWREIADEEFGNLPRSKYAKDTDLAAEAAKLKVSDLYREIEEATDSDRKAELMFRAAVKLVAFRPSMTKAQQEEVFNLFNGASELLRNPDAKAMLAELSRASLILNPSQDEVDHSNKIIHYEDYDYYYDPVRLFEKISGMLEPMENTYNSYHLLRDYNNDNVSVDNALRTVWYGIEWYRLMSALNGSPKIDDSTVREYAALLEGAAFVWMKDPARLNEVPALTQISANLRGIAEYIDAEHKGTYTF